MLPCTKAWQLALSRSLSLSHSPHILYVRNVVHAPLSPLRQWQWSIDPRGRLVSLGTARITGNTRTLCVCACTGAWRACAVVYIFLFFFSFLRRLNFLMHKTCCNYLMSDFSWYLTGTAALGRSNLIGWVRPQMVEPQISIPEALWKKMEKGQNVAWVRIWEEEDYASHLMMITWPWITAANGRLKKPQLNTCFQSELLTGLFHSRHCDLS